MSTLACALVVALSLVAQTQLPLTVPTAAQIRSLDSLLVAEFASSPTGGVALVAYNGRPLVRRGYGKANIELDVAMQPDHVFKIGSITKQFTAVAILQLAEQGKLSLGEDVRTHLPDFNTHGRRISIEQVLTHTSGLPNLVDLPTFDSLARNDYTPSELLDLTRAIPLHFEPGTSFRYSDTGYILLGIRSQRYAAGSG